MNDWYIQSWWMVGLRGIIAIAFGIMTLLWPGITMISLIALFAAYALLGGIVAIYGAIRHRGQMEDWWLPLLLGLFSVGAGIVTIVHPAMTALILVLLIGANAMVTGILDIATAIRMRKTIKNEWMLALSGVLSLIFGALVFLLPGPGALALTWLIGVYALFTGALLLGLAFRLRSRAHIPYTGVERRVTPDRRVSMAH